MRPMRASFNLSLYPLIDFEVNNVRYKVEIVVVNYNQRRFYKA